MSFEKLKEKRIQSSGWGWIYTEEDVLAFLKEQEDDRKTARKCLLYRGTPDCSNKDCINFTCPLNKNKKRQVKK